MSKPNDQEESNHFDDEILPLEKYEWNMLY